jgi:hypothetical protein
VISILQGVLSTAWLAGRSTSPVWLLWPLSPFCGPSVVPYLFGNAGKASNRLGGMPWIDSGPWCKLLRSGSVEELPVNGIPAVTTTVDRELGWGVQGELLSITSAAKEGP